MVGETIFYSFLLKTDDLLRKNNRSEKRQIQQSELKIANLLLKYF
jgi:hypothetical protein